MTVATIAPVEAPGLQIAVHSGGSENAAWFAVEVAIGSGAGVGAADAVPALPHSALATATAGATDAAATDAAATDAAAADAAATDAADVAAGHGVAASGRFESGIGAADVFAGVHALLGGADVGEAVAAALAMAGAGNAGALLATPAGGAGAGLGMARRLAEPNAPSNGPTDTVQSGLQNGPAFATGASPKFILAPPPGVSAAVRRDESTDAAVDAARAQAGERGAAAATDAASVRAEAAPGVLRGAQHAATAAQADAASATRVPVAQLESMLAERIGAGARVIRLQLTPPHLGMMELRVRVDAQGAVHLQIEAETAQAAAQLQAQMTALQQSLAVHGLRLGQLAMQLTGQGERPFGRREQDTKDSGKTRAAGAGADRGRLGAAR